MLGNRRAGRRRLQRRQVDTFHLEVCYGFYPARKHRMGRDHLQAWASKLCRIRRQVKMLYRPHHDAKHVAAWEYCIKSNTGVEDAPQHVTVLEASESASFPNPSQVFGLPRGEDYRLFSEASPASAVYSHLRLQLPESREAPLAEDTRWPESTQLDDEDSEVLLPLATAFLVPRTAPFAEARTSASTSFNPLSSEALQVNTLLSWTSELSTLSVWRRSVFDVQRDWMSNFSDLASLAHARFQDSSLRWWPYHLLVIDMMVRASASLISSICLECREQEQEGVSNP